MRQETEIKTKTQPGRVDGKLVLNYVYPVYRMTVYPGVIKVSRKCLLKEKRKLAAPRRKVKRWSKRSWNRLTFLVRSTSVSFSSLLTLTYCTPPKTMGESKADLNRFLTKLRGFGVQYIWVLEFQTRGAPHYHILLDVKQSELFTRARMAAMWIKSIRPIPPVAEQKKMTKVGEHVTSWFDVWGEEGAKKYLLAYATKLSQKTPIGEYEQATGRFWGNSKGVKSGDGIVVDITEEELREWLFYQGRENMENWEVLPKYIWTKLQA